MICYTTNLLRKSSIKALLLLFMWLVAVGGWATDVRNAGELKQALGNATEFNGLVTLTADVVLYETIQITDGTMTLVVPQGRTLTIDRTGSKEEAKGVWVNGANAQLIIKGGGMIVTKAQNGEKGNDVSGFKLPGNGGDGQNARTIILSNGQVLLYDVLVRSIPGNGGEPGKNTTFGNYGNSGNSGNVWTIDVDDSFTLGNIIPYGSYIKGYKGDYTTRDEGIQEQDVTVSLTNYKVTYNTNGGSPQPTPFSYNIEKADYEFPSITKNGYTFVNWTCNGSPINKDKLPTTAERVSDVNLTFIANWTPTSYKVEYNTDGGNTIAEGSYNIEQGIPTLPIPTKNGYLFDGWYKNGSLVTTIPAGTENITLTAHWLERYQITYDLAGGSTSETLKDEYTEKTETFTLPLPTRDGYTFLGWYNAANQKIEIIKKGTTGDLSLTAQWKITQYTLKFKTNCDKTVNDLIYSKDKTITLPDLTGSKPGYDFKGWFDNAACAGAAITASTVPYPKDNTQPTTLYAKWEAQKHTITFVTNGGSAIRPLEYAFDKETTLPKKTTKAGYTFAGWYENKDFSGEAIASIKQYTKYVDFTLYAKWTPFEYDIEFKFNHGAFLPGTVKPEKYTIESDDILLPIPCRDVFSFVGWYDNDLLTGATQAFIKKGSVGDKTFYAKWTAGSVVSFNKLENGTIAIKSGDKEIKNGENVGGGIPLKITATPGSAIYKLSKLIVGGIPYTTNSVDTVMPATGGLTVSAEFADPRPSASAPKITTSPENTDFIPTGADVKVALANTDNGATLYYSLDNSTPKKYTEPFLVSSATAKTVKVSAIARKDGHKDGITNRDIKFGSGKITISFNLPKGITATNPLGGEVVSAVASGGTFQFKLNVDEDYFETLDSIRVEANGTILKADAYGVYTLSEQKANVTVKVTGITGVTYTITLTQTPNGHVSFTDQDTSFVCIVNRGDRVSIKAEADEDYKFVSWSDGNQSNPREIIAESHMNLQTRFVTDADHYMVVFPEMEGVTIKTLTNYSQEVKRGGTCKFYLRLDADYDQSVPVVKANGEVLTVNKEVYSLYNIKNNYSISVSGIQKNKIKVEVAENVIVTNVETMTDATKMDLLPEAVVNMYAKAPVGKVFLKWNDGKADNPRISTAQDASQLLPLFTTSASGETFGKVVFITPVGAGVSAINANADAVKAGGDLQFKVVVLPQYSRSKVKVTANDKEIQSELELRASTETTSFIYTLKGVAGETKINVSGLVLNDYTLVIEQKAGGTIRANQSGLLKHGTEVTLSATPASGNMFVKWSDGNTLNPYPYKIIGDMTMNAVFIQSNSPVDNEIKPSLGRIYVVENTLHIDANKPTNLYIWNYNGQLVQNTYIQAGHSTFHLSQGNYIIKTATNPPLKILVR